MGGKVHASHLARLLNPRTVTIKAGLSLEGFHHYRFAEGLETLQERGIQERPDRGGGDGEHEDEDEARHFPKRFAQEDRRGATLEWSWPPKSSNVLGALQNSPRFPGPGGVLQQNRNVGLQASQAGTAAWGKMEESWQDKHEDAAQMLEVRCKTRPAWTRQSP